MSVPTTYPSMPMGQPMMGQPMMMGAPMGMPMGQPMTMPAGFTAAPTTMAAPMMGMPMMMGAPMMGGFPGQMPTNPPEELPGDKLTPQECASYGVPFGAVWGAVQSAEPAMEAEDDVRGTQV